MHGECSHLQIREIRNGNRRRKQLALHGGRPTECHRRECLGLWIKSGLFRILRKMKESESGMDTNYANNFKLNSRNYRFPETAARNWDSDSDIPDEEKSEEWGSVCYHFTQNTTFHGINKITESTPFCIRR